MEKLITIEKSNLLRNRKNSKIKKKKKVVRQLELIQPTSQTEPGLLKNEPGLGSGRIRAQTSRARAAITDSTPFSSAATSGPPRWSPAILSSPPPAPSSSSTKPSLPHYATLPATMTVLLPPTQQSNIVCIVAVAVDKIHCWWKQTTFIFPLHNCNGPANNCTAAPE